MVPGLVHRIGKWLDCFSDALDRWESLLCDLRSAYFRQDLEHVERLMQSIDQAKSIMLASKAERESILIQADNAGLKAANLRELSRLLDSQWPALWTHRLMGLENQISRIQQLGVSLWIHSTESRDLVTELMHILGAKSPQVIRQNAPVDHHPSDVAEPVIIPFERKAA